MTSAPGGRPLRSPGVRAARLVLATAAIAVLLAPACHRDILLLPAAAGNGGAGGGVTGAAGMTGAAGAAGSPPACVGLGDPIVLPTAAGPTCAAALETRGHRFALCACDALSLDGKLRTDAFDSTDSSVSDEISAAVGVNGGIQIQPNAELRAGGAIYVAAAAGISPMDHLQAGASFRSNGPLAMQSSNADLLADAYVVGDVSGSVNVTGTLHVSATATVGPDVQDKGPLARDAVPVAAPCDCSAGFVDVAGAIASAAASNGDAAAGFGPDALSNVLTSTQLTLGCGTYYLASIGATDAPVTLVVKGHALLAVQGSVALGGGLTVTLSDPAAELDLLVGGWFTASGGTVGAPAAPARFRIWIGGTESLVFDNQPTIAAVVHAPGAPATAPDGLTLSGSLLVKSLTLDAGAQSLLHYDRAILSAGVPCGEPAAAVVP